MPQRYRWPLRLFIGAVACGLAAAGAAWAWAGTEPSPAELEAKLRDQALRWVIEGRLARDDGFIYTVDAAQLLTYAALRQDRELYAPLRELLVGGAVVDNQSDPYTRGFVAWRFRPPVPPASPSTESSTDASATQTLDATGTTEALRLAQGLWLGAEAFHAPADRELALLILHGYTRHAATERGIWLIRNYFNLQTRAFATNSFLVDYDPDFLRSVADDTGDAELRDASDRSYRLVKRAVAPCGLLYDLIQPEVRTLMPELDQVVFSPNDVVQVSNACAVAERAVGEAPEVGRGVLAYAMKRGDKLTTYALGRTGEPPPEGAGAAPGLEAHAALVRLAVRLGDRQAAARITPALLKQARLRLTVPHEPRAYAASEALLTLALLNPAATQPEKSVSHR